MSQQEQTTEFQSSPEEGQALIQILIQILEEEATEILSKMDHELLRERERWDHSKSNYTSQIHHPCLKHLVHWRVDWKEAQLIDIDGLYRVKEGSELERQIKIEFSNIGYEVNLAQRYFRDDELQISGRIDGSVPLKRELPDPYSHIKELPIEVKSVNPHFWGNTKSILDLRRHPKFWINKIPSQLNIYLSPRMMELPAGFIVLLTFGKRPRILPMLYDPELYEADSEKARKVNKHVENGSYPEPIPYDPSVCNLCPFNHMCNPPRASNLIQINHENRWELEDFLLLKEQNRQYEKLKAELIGSKKKPGKYYGKNGVFEDIEIKSSKRTRKKFDIPKKEKDKFYVGTDEYYVTKIERVGKEF